MHAVGELWAWARHRRRRFRVEGRSMLPTLAPDSFVLIDEQATARVGDVVVVNHPAKPLMIVKRVAARSSEGLLDLRSDNPDEGSDSRHFGRIDPDRLLGVVTVVLEWPFPSVAGGLDRDRGADRTR